MKGLDGKRKHVRAKEAEGSMEVPVSVPGYRFKDDVLKCWIGLFPWPMDDRDPLD